MNRCHWTGQDPLLIAYHDTEWGVPVHDDRKLFEFLILEGAQAGLSWRTILMRRDAYRRVFADFDPEAVARFTPETESLILTDPGIIRNRLKVSAAVTNARAFLAVQEAFGSFDRYAWQFVHGRQKVNAFETPDQVPATSPESDAFSRDLRQRGFKFTGSIIMYSHMQATGMVNDHLTGCCRYHAVMASDLHP